jgi:hypothetical protein
MTDAPTHVRLDLHPQDNSAVRAHVSGLRAATALHILLGHGFQYSPSAEPDTLVLVRIDHEEAHYAESATRALCTLGIAVAVHPSLQEGFEEDPAMTDYGIPGLDREDIRALGAEAQQIHDDIATGRLAIHHHAREDGILAEVGTHAAGYSVHLLEEGYRRHVTRSFDSRADAVAEFFHIYGGAVRPGPAPATSSEQRIASILAPPAKPDSTNVQRSGQTELVPVYDGDPGDHAELLNTFLAQGGEWERYRPHDETTIANHESLLMGVEFVHEPGPGEAKWTVAAYESQVGERLWHATATGSTPVEIVSVLLDTLASGSARATGPAVSEEAIVYVAQPLTGWAQSVEGRFIRWAPPRGGRAGVQLDAFAAQARTGRDSRTWTVWGGGNADNPVWAIHLSSQTPARAVHDLVGELAEGLCARPRTGLRPLPARQSASTRLRAATSAPAPTPPTPAHVSTAPHRQER